MSKKTIDKIVKSGNIALIQVKGNQGKLLKDCKAATNLEAYNTYSEPITKERNRIEKRKVEVFIKFNISSKDKWGNHIKAIIKVTRDREVYNTKTKNWEHSQEIAYFLSTKILLAEKLCKAIRNHWGIENRNHYVRDVTLKEDNSRIRINPNIMVKLRSFTLNILRINDVKNISNELWNNILSVERLFKYNYIF